MKPGRTAPARTGKVFKAGWWAGDEAQGVER
jgi:hypothetical protein